jgi:hypothetical protein
MKCPLDPKLGPPCMADMIVPCTNMDPLHRKCFRHPEDDIVVEEVIDEAPDEMDAAVIRDEEPWTAPEVGDVSEDAAMEAKMAAAEAAANGDYASAAASYSTALAANPSALTYAKLCVGNKIDEDEGSAALQKRLKAKVDKLKKIAEQRAKREAAAAAE